MDEQTAEYDTEVIGEYSVTYVGTVREAPEGFTTHYAIEWPRLTPDQRKKMTPEQAEAATRKALVGAVDAAIPNVLRHGNPTGKVLAVASIGQLWIETVPTQAVR